MTAYRELIERLERATGPDREIDALLMSLGHFRDKRHAGAYYEDNTPAFDDVWVDRRTDKWRSTAAFEFTASIDEAVGMIGHLLPRYRFYVGNWNITAAVLSPDRNNDQRAEAATPALSLCLATLRALEAQSKDKEEGE